MKIIDEDLTGREFGRFTVRERDPYDNSKWICECSCEKKTIKSISVYALKSGRTQGCGCVARDKNILRNTKHGLSKTKIYKKWKYIKKRCLNKHDKEYHNYGGRGITLSEEWINDAKSFIDYVSKLPDYEKPGYSLDRIDNEGNYERGNLRWASSETQVQNTRRTIFSENDILEIREMLKTKKCKEISDIFTVPIGYISNIKNNKSWKNIQLEDEG